MPHRNILRLSGDRPSSASPSFDRAAAPRRLVRPQAAARKDSAAAAQLVRLSTRMDELIHSVSLGTASHRQHELHVAEGEAIAAGIRATFRGEPVEDPVNPPLWQRGGRAAW